MPKGGLGWGTARPEVPSHGATHYQVAYHHLVAIYHLAISGQQVIPYRLVSDPFVPVFHPPPR